MDLGVYAEELIFNYEHPHGKSKMGDADVSIHEENISCGDRITVYLKVKEGKISDISFEGSGCVISMGTASILMDYLRGKSIEEVEKMGKDKLVSIINIDPGPSRLHCATLTLRAARKALLIYQKKPIDRDTKEL